MTQDYGLSRFGLRPARVYRNLPTEVLVEHTLANQEGVLGMNGATMCKTGKFTGRSPKDKYFVEEPGSQQHINWGPVNQKISQATFDRLLSKVVDALTDKDLYVFDGFAGADETYQLPMRIVTQKAWHAHFAHNMFIRPTQDQLAAHSPQFTILNACDISATDYKELGLNSEVFIVFDLGRGLAIIGGTMYAGEMKKGIFSVLNYLLPLKGVLSMHCSANVGKAGDVALFFGLSGTGKTTLSADPNRALIGDDEHGWSDHGVFNFEGGCYAKCIQLSEEKEPDIWRAIRFGALLENVVYDPQTRAIDFDDKSITENTRVSYPLHHIDNALIPSRAGHPNTIIFLTCDAFGVLPPVSRLTPGQAMYHFLSGYTAKVAGTERGVTEPTATFSTCFGAPFLPLRPGVYANLLGEKMAKHGARAYLVNTGWTGGGYGVGKRMSLPATRAMITAILNGNIEKSDFRPDPYFGFEVPVQLDGVDAKLLDPSLTWQDPAAYRQTAEKLVGLFKQNFKTFAEAAEFEPFGPK
ncbi:MAG: phosphoenolpyruvate carboxykinase (ATP) [Acidobacteria bacterium]|nr:phosphoenolpyruvate carboxykinase (ATP) [Acidobacteriota bacterium]